MDDVTAKDVESDIAELTAVDMVCRYRVGGEEYLHIINFAKHQRINRPSESPLPCCPHHDDDGAPQPGKPVPEAPFTEPSSTTHGALSEPSVSPQPSRARPGSGSGREVEKEEEQLPPTHDGLFPPPSAAAEAEGADKPRSGGRRKKLDGEPKPLPPADELTNAFWEIHGKGQTQSWVAIRGIVRTALTNGVDRNDIACALDLLAREQTAISGGTLQTARKRLAQAHARSSGVVVPFARNGHLETADIVEGYLRRSAARNNTRPLTPAPADPPLPWEVAQ